jgi:hypothetical protein
MDQGPRPQVNAKVKTTPRGRGRRAAHDHDKRAERSTSQSNPPHSASISHKSPPPSLPSPSASASVSVSTHVSASLVHLHLSPSPSPTSSLANAPPTGAVAGTFTLTFLPFPLAVNTSASGTCTCTRRTSCKCAERAQRRAERGTGPTAGPPPCELERRTGAGADGAGGKEGEAAPERVCDVVVVVVRGREMPVVRCVGVRWCGCWCGCVGVRKSGGRLWRLAVGVVVMLLVVVVGTATGGGLGNGSAVVARAVGVLSSVGREGGALRRRETQSPLKPKLRRPHSPRLGGAWNSPGEPRVTLRKTSTASKRHNCAMPRRFSRTTCGAQRVSQHVLHLEEQH